MCGMRVQQYCFTEPSALKLLKELSCVAQAQQENVLKRAWRLFVLYVSKMKVHI